MLCLRVFGPHRLAPYLRGSYVPLCQHYYLLKMSMVPSIVELTDAECEKGQVTPQPPILYAKSKAGLLVQASRDTIKLNTLEGESKQGLLGNNLDAEEFILHFSFFTRHLEKTGVEDKLKKATELAESLTASLKKLLHAPVKEKEAPSCSCEGKGRS